MRFSSASEIILTVTETSALLTVEFSTLEDAVHFIQYISVSPPIPLASVRNVGLGPFCCFFLSGFVLGFFRQSQEQLGLISK